MSHFLNIREQLPKFLKATTKDEKKEIPEIPVLTRQNTMLSTKDGGILINGNPNGCRLFEEKEDDEEKDANFVRLKFCDKCFDFCCFCV